MTHVNQVQAEDNKLIIDFTFTPRRAVSYIEMSFLLSQRKTRVHNWRFEAGEPEFVGKSVIYPDGYRDGVPRGWYCWVYPENDIEFEQWMNEHCPTADYTHRFNSGDPMYTVYVSSEEESTLFVLKWL